MTADEEFVRANCNDPLHTTHTYGGSACAIVTADNVRVGHGINEQSAWSAAAEFTRDRLEQIRQVEEEIAVLHPFAEGRTEQALTKMPVWANDTIPSLLAAGKAIVRTLSRLEAIRDDLKRGLRK